MNTAEMVSTVEMIKAILDVDMSDSYKLRNIYTMLHRLKLELPIIE